ncbi:MAG TPA: hypothetical protein VKR56_13480 [Candidatus Cybelea sp.]|nr:hypothetical protein [Candidatus Cybelea sp.]
MPLKPIPRPSPSPTAPPVNVLPFDSTLLFVLDDPISSKSSKAGQIVRAHLKSSIVVNGRTVAAAGAPGQIRIVNVSGSDIEDKYGFVDIFFEPLTLADGRDLPLRAPAARLEPGVSYGHESTVEAEDTVGDIFVPYYTLWQILRHGKNFVLNPGSEVPARTEATITAQADGTIAIVTPRPLPQGSEVPDATFPLSPLATPLPTAAPIPKVRPTPTPSPSPDSTPAPPPPP